MLAARPGTAAEPQWPPAVWRRTPGWQLHWWDWAQVRGQAQAQTQARESAQQGRSLQGHAASVQCELTTGRHSTLAALLQAVLWGGGVWRGWAAPGIRACVSTHSAAPLPPAPTWHRIRDIAFGWLRVCHARALQLHNLHAPAQAKPLRGAGGGLCLQSNDMSPSSHASQTAARRQAAAATSRTAAAPSPHVFVVQKMAVHHCVASVAAGLDAHACRCSTRAFNGWERSASGVHERACINNLPTIRPWQAPTLLTNNGFWVGHGKHQGVVEVSHLQGCQGGESTGT